MVSYVLTGLAPVLHRCQADGLKLRGHVLNFTTPAVRDIGGASLCIRLEEQEMMGKRSGHTGSEGDYTFHKWDHL